jgi:hypothetical protein
MLTSTRLIPLEIVAARHPQGATAVHGELSSVARHLANVRLGAGHQSPDYQWWHGQPALDGDLIRRREVVARAAREETGMSQASTSSARKRE